MDRTLHIPLDFESQPQVRILKGRVGQVNALAAVLILFRDLGYAAGEGDPVGHIVGPKLELVASSLKEYGFDCKIEDLTAEGSMLVPATEGYFCPLFATTNRHLAKDYVTIQSAGGRARSLKLKQQQAEMEAPKQLGMLQADMFVFEGTPMTVQEKNRCIQVIKFFDNVSGRKDRLNREFESGLIQDAYQVIKHFEAESINRAGVQVMKIREKGHEARTEDILRNFEQWCGEARATAAAA